MLDIFIIQVYTCIRNKESTTKKENKNMKKVIRKGVQVRYIGNDELAKGRTFTVYEKYYSHIVVYFPTKYLDGSVHSQKCGMPIADFEIVQ